MKLAHTFHAGTNSNMPGALCQASEATLSCYILSFDPGENACNFAAILLFWLHLCLVLLLRDTEPLDYFASYGFLNIDSYAQSDGLVHRRPCFDFLKDLDIDIDNVRELSLCSFLPLMQFLKRLTFFHPPPLVL